MSDEIDGVKIQRLPTVGSALSLKTSRYKKSSLWIKTKGKEAGKIREIKKVLSQPDEVKK